jgi:hypothetical protein
MRARGSLPQVSESILYSHLGLRCSLILRSSSNTRNCSLARRLLQGVIVSGETSERDGCSPQFSNHFQGTLHAKADPLD